MKRIILFICFAACLISLVVPTVFAHPGKTDSQGGHTDHSTGEYHYHHGYSAHDHYDMDGDGVVDCPYNFDDKTDHSSGDSNSSSSYVTTPRYTTPPATVPTHIQTVTQKEDELVPNWVYWVLFILSVSTIISFVSNKRKQNTIDHMKYEHKNEIALLRNSCDKRIALKNATDAEIECIRSEVAELTEKRKELLILLRKDQEKLDDLKLIRCRMKNAPLDITFANDGMPIYWKPSTVKPYGDYSVYINEKNNIYHVDRLCASIRSSKEHIFNVIGHARPCKKCAEGFFDFTTVPDWFFSTEDTVQTNIFDDPSIKVNWRDQ